MAPISPLFRIPFIAITLGLHHHAINPRSAPGLQRNDDTMSEKTVLRNIRAATGLVQASTLTLITFL